MQSNEFAQVCVQRLVAGQFFIILTSLPLPAYQPNEEKEETFLLHYCS